MLTKTINLVAKPFQWDFLSSNKRYPSMIAGWGTGKTMLALYKCISLSQAYDNNYGVIVREKFTDLRDSTMKDYTKYTGKHVPQGTKASDFVNGSQIVFRHAKDLSGLQNINIGFFYIEQAEEFPTERQFTLLRGRLRRVLTPKTEVQIQLTKIISDITKLPALKEVCDDWERLSAKAEDINGNRIVEKNEDGEDYELNLRDIAERALVGQLGITLRQGMVIANAKGHNWSWKKFIKSPMDDSMCSQANSYENQDNLPRDTILDWGRLKIESPATYSQYVMNCHDEVDLDACYWASRLSEIRKTGHMGVVKYDPSVRVHLAADVGLDCTAIWFFQLIGQKKLFIDYYENTGKFADHYTRILDEKKRDNDYIYGKFVMPHDANKREMVSQTTLSKSFKDLGYDIISLPREQNIDFGINNVNNILKSCWFDENKCELGLEALQHYRREYNEELKIYLEKPLHDWSSHPADSIRYACKAITMGLFGTTKGVTKEQIAKWNKKYRRTG